MNVTEMPKLWIIGKTNEWTVSASNVEIFWAIFCTKCLYCNTASMLEHKKQVNSASRWLVIIKMMLDQSIFLRTTTMTMMIVMMLKEKSFVSSEADQMDWVSKGCHLICCLAIDWKQTTSAVLINIITITTGTIIILYIQHYLQHSDNIPSGSQLSSWLSL